jgi:hypothetical protein
VYQVSATFLLAPLGLPSRLQRPPKTPDEPRRRCSQGDDHGRRLYSFRAPPRGTVWLWGPPHTSTGGDGFDTQRHRFENQRSRCQDAT